MSWLTRVGQALSGEIVFEYESTVEPVSGKRQRRFHHQDVSAFFDEGLGEGTAIIQRFEVAGE